MKPGRKAPALEADAVALALAAAFTCAAALAFYGARGARALSRRLAPSTAAAPIFDPRPQGAAAAAAGRSSESSPLPYAGEELRAPQVPPELARRETPKPAAGYPPLEQAM